MLFVARLAVPQVSESVVLDLVGAVCDGHLAGRLGHIDDHRHTQRGGGDVRVVATVVTGAERRPFAVVGATLEVAGALGVGVAIAVAHRDVVAHVVQKVASDARLSRGHACGSDDFDLTQGENRLSLGALDGDHRPDAAARHIKRLRTDLNVEGAERTIEIDVEGAQPIGLRRCGLIRHSHRGDLVQRSQVNLPPRMVLFFCLSARSPLVPVDRSGGRAVDR
mmetsp:Transcript_121460/g.388495  ORF Transcript_121460/g.388495 Transcript_121460/m.388495 type:complete len:222 (-) Transcript_121460:319-984(-)